MVEQFAAAGILKKYIKSFYVIETNCSTIFMPSERVFPFGGATLVFHYGNPSLFKKKDEDAYIEPKLVVCGPQSKYYDLSLAGKTGMVFIAFKPHGLYPFFNIPIRELLNENLALEELIKHEAKAIEEKLALAESNHHRIKIMEAFLFNRLKENKDLNRIEYAIQRIENFRGNIKTEKLAQELCLSIKQFERIFSKNTGLNPKKYISIVKFLNVLEMKRKHKGLNLYRLAYENGYYDQSHFTHDFLNLTGFLPKEYFKEKV